MGSAQNGLFVTFEGGEGAGKSTQSRLLADRLVQAGLEVVMTREPGGTPTAETLRTLLLDPNVALDPMEQVLLFYTARHNHVEQVIRPALRAGKVVICDRFSDSTAAYQGAAGGLGSGVIAEVDRIVLDGFKPDLTILLDLAVDTGNKRITARGEATDRFEQAPVAFHDRLREAFLEIAGREPDRVVVFDAAEQATVIAEQVFATVQGRLNTAGLAE